MQPPTLHHLSNFFLKTFSEPLDCHSISFSRISPKASELLELEDVLGAQLHSLHGLPGDSLCLSPLWVCCPAPMSSPSPHSFLNEHLNVFSMQETLKENIWDIVSLLLSLFYSPIWLTASQGLDVDIEREHLRHCQSATIFILLSYLTGSFSGPGSLDWELLSSRILKALLHCCWPSG